MQAGISNTQERIITLLYRNRKMRQLTKVKLQIRETQKTYYMYYMIALALYYDVYGNQTVTIKDERYHVR